MKPWIFTLKSKLYDADYLKNKIWTHKGPGHGTIAQVSHYGWPSEETVAVAQLISAAPELYEACKEFVRKVECGEARSRKSYKQMKEAIAKAEGTKKCKD